MPLAPIPQAVRRFLERSVRNVEQLEILLLLAHQCDRWWDADAVSDALRLPPRDAAAHLEALARRDLLDVRIGDAMRYRYAPVTEKQVAAMRQLTACYRENRGAVVGFVAARRQSLQDFADAFRIGEEDQDG